MKKQLFLVASLLIAPVAASAAVAPVYALANPAGWAVGTALSTSQDWAANSTDRIDGIPNVSFNDAGAGLTAPTFTVSAPGFVAGSGGFYSFSGAYDTTASLHAPTVGVPAGAGTYVIVQTFATLNESTIDSVHLTDPTGTALAGVQHLQSTLYGYQPHFASSFGDVEAQATIDEFWIPNFTSDFSVVAHALDDVSFQELRIDTILAAPSVTGGAPFATTVVPEPASLAACGFAVLPLLRRRKTA